MKACAALGATVLAAAGLSFVAVPAQAAPSASNTLTVHADEPFRAVTHVASGSLYGLATATTPSDSLVEPIKPSEFVLKPAGGTQQPTGDILQVDPEAEKAGAKVVDRLSDYYPGWPYQFSWANWFNVVDQQIAQVKASGITNLAAYALWNEPDNTWLSQNGTFEDFWTKTYNEVRRLDPTTPIQGPSESDNINDMQNFLQNAVATNTVPDILAWHELENSGKIVSDIAKVEGYEKALGIGPLPIDIEEYAAPAQVGIPGQLVGYLAKFERLGVQNAELAFWNQSGALGDLLTGQGGKPNGAYWLYTWYADMSGDMVTSTPPSTTGTFDAAASITSDKKELDVITGGSTGATTINIAGLDKTSLGSAVNVKLEYTPSHGRTTAVAGPTTISNVTYKVGADGSINVPIVMNPDYGYHIVVTPATSTQSTLAGIYTITNVNSGLALDTAGDSSSSGTLVNQATAAGSTTQTWKLVDAGSGLYKIQNAESGLDLGIQNQSTTNGAPVVEWSDDAGTDDHLWQPIPDGNGNYRFANYGTGLVLAVDGMSKADGAQVEQWTDGSPTIACTAAGARQPGKIGTALSFCGTNAYVKMPTGVVKSLTGDYTVSAWVNPASNATWSRVFDIGTGTNAYMFLTLTAGSGLRYAITTSGAGGEQQINATNTLPLNQWSLVTVTVANGTGTLYVNGNAVGTKSNMTASPSSFGASANNYIGKSQYGGDPALNATVDDFNIYDRALSATDVQTLASGQAGAGDVVHYAFDESGGGATVVDSSGTGQNGTIVNGTQTTTTDSTDAATADHFWTLHAVTAPGAPTAAAALDKDATSIDVTWSAPGSNGGTAITGYKVYRVGVSDPVATVGADATTAQITGVWPGDTATFTVKAVNLAGVSPDSAQTNSVTIPDGASSAPGKAVLSDDNGWDTGLQDGSYNVTMNLWWGETGSVFKLYENGKPIATKKLTFNGVGAQTVTVPVSGNINGTYVYSGELINSKGTTATGNDTVKVTQANPAKPVLSSNAKSGASSYTITANLWWGTNATSYTFYKDGVAVGQGTLKSDTPNAQTATLQVSGMAAGTYTYTVGFTNAAGTTTSDPLTVKVTG
ncbi:hypothetical protein GCM10027568_29850 [Humibacter soli]